MCKAASTSGECAVYIASLHLRNFRNYQRLDLTLPQGLVVFTGGNAQGKSNLLEAVYLLAIGRSTRAGSEGEMVGWRASGVAPHAQAMATVATCQGSLQLQVDLVGQELGVGDAAGSASPVPSVQKRVRVNGVPRLVSGLVGQFNAVLFDAADIQVIEGAPSLRRRYLDVLLSQVDPAYLRALQRYQRVLAQRNQLLRLMREGRARGPELEFWDGELAQQGAYLVASRLEAMASLVQLAGPMYARLKGGEEQLQLAYLSTGPQFQEQEELRQGLMEALVRGRRREVALGSTQVGPHRDDVRITVAGRELGVFGSRGERRLAALALRLAEGEFLAQRRGEQPVMLLDDILSELDQVRGMQVMEAVACYQQVLLTTTEAPPLAWGAVTPTATFRVVGGTVTPLPSESSGRA